jgi:short-subunit dehydrogenase
MLEQADVSDIKSLNLIYEKIKNKTVTGLINCAGVFESLPFAFFPYENYKKGNKY